MKKEMAGEYINAALAVMAMQSCQMYFIMGGYSVTSSTYLSQQRCELTVHFDGLQMPKLPAGYSCSSYEIESDYYYSECLKRVNRVRTKTFYYSWPAGGK